jgi:hypothetical protein
MTSTTVYYTTGPEPDDYMHIAMTGDVAYWDISYVAELCAQAYYDNSNWEGEDSIPFWLWTHDVDAGYTCLGKFEVHREFEPYFTAYEKVEPKPEVPVEKQVTAAYVESLTPYMVKPK